MNRKWTIKTVVSAILLFPLALGSLAGCQGLLFNLKGSRVKDGYGINLVQSGEKSGYFQSRDLTVNYHYTRSGSQLNISGYVEYASYVTMGFTAIENFNLGVVLADDQSNVLSDQSLISAGDFDPRDKLHFQRTLTLPPGTAMMAFTYRGNAEEGGSRFSDDSANGGTQTTFWQFPVVK